MRILAYIFMFIGIQSALAWSPEAYTSHSRLASGNWVKISIPESGLYALNKKQLAEWGFSDPTKVRIYGYGAAQPAKTLELTSYTDDLPMVQSMLTDQGIVFYGQGPETWSMSAKGVMVNHPNQYTDAAYYFLTQSDEPVREIERQGLPQASNPASTFTKRLHYETDRISVGEAGYDLVGESLKSTRKITFDALGGPAKIECAIVSNTTSEGLIRFTANGTPLEGNNTDAIAPVAVSEFIHAGMSISAHEFVFSGQKLELAISASGTSPNAECWLNYVSLNVETPLSLPSAGHMCFGLNMPEGNVQGTSAEGLNVWDVTDPQNITSINLGTSAEGACWTNDHAGERQYATWIEGAALPAPTYVGAVANQDIHGMECVDMVIFTPRAYIDQARRIAQWHENSKRPLKVAVIEAQQAYNEFSSGVQSPAAFRHCLKMLYDRSMADATGAQLKYALLLAPVTYDNRHLTSQFDGSNDYPTLPGWLSEGRQAQFNDNLAYPTDDYTAMLSDGSGSNPSTDKLSIAIGRLPVYTLSQAKQVTDKILQYGEDSHSGTWKNSMLFLADDGDNGTHALDTEKIITAIEEGAPKQYLINKVYVDAYEIVNGSCENGRQEMWRLLREGAMWWNYTGHANKYSWTSENMLTYNDINNLSLTRLPVLMAATCNFMRWDSQTTSGAELMMHNRYGGTIATISATRPVYIADNGFFTQAIGRALTQRDTDGETLRIGDIYKNAKNDIRDSQGRPRGDTNRLRYALMGDPAMALVLPKSIVQLDSIDGEAISPEKQLTLKALQRARLSGSVRNYDGSLLDDFNGNLAFDLYDAECSTTTLGKREGNVELTYEQHGKRLHSGSATITGGRFTALLHIPSEIMDNFRPATINMAATSADGRTAAGTNSDFYVYGIDETQAADTIAPVIEKMYLNHETFRNGGAVNASPVLIAKISDNIAINMSMAGIGHQMTLTIDDKTTYSDVALYYTPSPNGSSEGTISYPLDNLTEGRHTLKLRVWDTSANSATESIDFVVDTNLAPEIYSIYTDANPAVDHVNFYLTHNRPEADLTVTVTVYSLMGIEVWKGSATGRTQSTRSIPVSWDLCNSHGARVPRGIYIYRAQVSEANGTAYNTASKKLAITGR